jgi:hypothetical protein
LNGIVVVTVFYERLNTEKEIYAFQFGMTKF